MEAQGLGKFCLPVVFACLLLQRTICSRSPDEIISALLLVPSHMAISQSVRATLARRLLSFDTRTLRVSHWPTSNEGDRTEP